MGNCIAFVFQLLRTGRIHRISGKKIRQIKQIAQGGYGYVLLVEDVDTKKNYALKKLICQTEEQRNAYNHEVEIMKKLSNCEHVIGYHGCHSIEREGYLQAYILMELGQRTVYDLLVEVDKKSKTLSEKQIIILMLQTSIGLKQMHDQGIIHQDVKVQNILISQKGKAKICDFGSCSTQKIDLSKVSKSAIYKYQERFEKNTTLMYRPPEMIDLYLQYPVDERVDVWMLGCVLFVLNYRYHPFQQEGKLSIVNAAIKYPKGPSEKMVDLMRHMLTPNPYFRPSVSQIIAILSKWDSLQSIRLNRVAQCIKDDEILVSRGQYDRTSKDEWRNYKA